MPQLSRELAIYSKQIDQLYSRLAYAAIGSVIVALLLVFTIGPKSNLSLAWAWFFILLLVSIYRGYISRLFKQQNATEKLKPKWKIYLTAGTYLAALTWAVSVWMFFPVEHPSYQAFMILAVAGISGGSLATLSYDKTQVTGFLLIMLLGVDIRILQVRSQLTDEISVIFFIYIMFLVKNGRDIALGNYELLALRHDTNEHNLTLLSTTEKIARIGYWQWDMRSKKIQLSKNLSSMCGIEEKYVDMDAFINTIHKDDTSRVRLSISSACSSKEENSTEFRMRDPNSDDWIIMNQVIKCIPDTNGTTTLLGTIQDISKIKSAEKKIFDMAYFDELTGLANRGHFHMFVLEKIKRMERNKEIFALLFLDLDGFKEVNDMHGHSKGDLFLMEYSQRLKAIFRGEDLIARLGGDEFCIVLNNIKEELDVTKAAERCLSISSEPIQIDDENISLSASIGIALYPSDGTDVETLLKAADTAMYSAKQKGKNCYVFYNLEMTAEAAERIKLESDLRHALKQREFKLLYQPKVSLSNGRVIGVEALIRWHHPIRGIVHPASFIDTAERIGLINDIGELILEESCIQLNKWKELGLNIEIAINISSSHFSSSDFLSSIERIKRVYNIMSDELEIEITESMSRNPNKHIEICRALHQQDIKVAIDDFGTGYSSLSLLTQLEIDTLKIDKSFIQHLPHDPSSILLVKTIIRMALDLGFDVVAEGAETLEQIKFLKELGCPYVQGYYFSKPVESEQIPALVNATFQARLE